MSIMTRIIRLWKADFNGLMDELEDKGLLVKQHIREMEEELEKKKQTLETMELDKEQLLQERNTFGREQEGFEKDLKVAILKEKDDIARMLVKNITVIQRNKKDIEQRNVVLEQQAQKLLERIKEQQVQYNQLKLKAREYLSKQERERDTSFHNESSMVSTDTRYEPSNEEIELELLKYKEMYQTTGQGGQS